MSKRATVREAVNFYISSDQPLSGDSLYFLFGGMLYDAMAGLYITKTRAYNPKTGRFLQRDILDEKGKDGVYAGFPFGKDAIGSNLYAWCGNNPASMEDPSGEWFNPRIAARKVFYRASLRHSIRTNNPAAAAKALWNLAFGNGQQIVKYRTYPGFGPVPEIKVRVNQKSTFNVGAAISDAKSWFTSNIAQPIAQPIINAQFRAMTGKEPGSTPYPASRYEDALDNSLNTASEQGWRTAVNWWNDPANRGPADPCVNAAAGWTSIILKPMVIPLIWNHTADLVNGHISAGDYGKQLAYDAIGYKSNAFASGTSSADSAYCSGIID
ncbi:MAG: RHS repeat-associated core domain-containing protein [Thermoleophilia bacterium]